MSLFQAILIGIMSCTAASTIACLGTTVGNYTLNRPLVASLFVGLISVSYTHMTLPTKRIVYI